MRTTDKQTARQTQTYTTKRALAKAGQELDNSARSISATILPDCYSTVSGSIKRNMASIKRGTFWLCFLCSGRIRRHIIRVCLCETVETERMQARYAAEVTRVLAALSFAVCSFTERYARGMTVILFANEHGTQKKERK